MEATKSKVFCYKKKDRRQLLSIIFNNSLKYGHSRSAVKTETSCTKVMSFFVQISFTCLFTECLFSHIFTPHKFKSYIKLSDIYSEKLQVKTLRAPAGEVTQTQYAFRILKIRTVSFSRTCKKAVLALSTSNANYSFQCFSRLLYPSRIKTERSTLLKCFDHIQEQQ